MWIGDTIFFNSDRDGHFNLYAYNIPSGRTTQVTTSKSWDVRWPSSDNENQIVYEMDGELQVLDARTRKSTHISINVPDEGNWSRPSRVAAGNLIESVGLSPKGERAVFAVGITNRGQLIDGGVVKVPESGFASKNGEWIIEGYGVDADIEVDNDPQSVIGKDPPLERAITEVMAKIKTLVKLPPKPAPPVKTIDRRETSKTSDGGRN